MNPTTVYALEDELRKIAAAQTAPPPTPRKGAFGPWLKRSLLISGGFGAGYAGGMLADRAAEAIGGPRWWLRASPTVRRRILPAAAGVAGMGLLLANDLVRREAARDAHK